MSDFTAHCRENSPMIMGIVNVTPDSFSDGGAYLVAQDAITHGLRLINQGAQILDVGGESTRPNAKIVTIEEEIARVVPVIKGLSGKAPFISIDTRNAATMHASIQAGANIINDVSGLLHDRDSVRVVAKSGLPVCIMHMQGTPQTMQDRPIYEDVVKDIFHFFEERIDFCLSHGVARNNIIIDVGIGFGKTLEHNLIILKNLALFQKLNCPVLLGVSRKSFIHAVNNAPDAADRLGGSLAAALYGLQTGVQIFRVHDVLETAQAFAVYQAIDNVS